MSTEPTPRRAASKVGNTGAPVGSTLSIIVAALAVIAGFLILKNISDDDESVSGVTPGTVASSPVDSAAVPSSLTENTLGSTTTVALITVGATVTVANASNIDGSARNFSAELAKKVFTMGQPTNAAGADAELATSKVYFLPGGEVVAASVAQVMGGVAVAPMPTPIPTSSGDMAGATVLVMLGKDLAGKPLPGSETADTVTATVGTAPLNTTTTTIAG